MADERDPRLSQHYRDLGAEEPPRALDQTILSAARRAVEKPHAPLVTPGGRHRWYFSLGAAAVIVLAVAVTYHMQQEQPDPDSLGISTAPEAQKDEAVKPAAKPESASRELAREPASPQAAPPAGPSAESQSRAMRAPQIETPERMLERIIRLRKEGRHDEADKLLAEFRRRYPDHQIPAVAKK